MLTYKPPASTHARTHTHSHAHTYSVSTSSSSIVPVDVRYDEQREYDEQQYGENEHYAQQLVDHFGDKVPLELLVNCAWPPPLLTVSGWVPGGRRPPPLLAVSGGATGGRCGRGRAGVPPRVQVTHGGGSVVRPRRRCWPGVGVAGGAACRRRGGEGRRRLARAVDAALRQEGGEGEAGEVATEEGEDGARDGARDGSALVALLLQVHDERGAEEGGGDERHHQHEEETWKERGAIWGRDTHAHAHAHDITQNMTTSDGRDMSTVVM